MIIGVPKEIKDNENRVALTPAGAQTLTQAGHSVLVQGLLVPGLVQVLLMKPTRRQVHNWCLPSLPGRPIWC